MKIDLKSSAGICLEAFLAVAPIIPLALYSPIPRIVNLTLAALIYLIAYLTLILLLRILNGEDLETLTRIFSKVTIIKPIIRLIRGYEEKIIRLIRPELWRNSYAYIRHCGKKVWHLVCEVYKKLLAQSLHFIIQL